MGIRRYQSPGGTPPHFGALNWTAASAGTTVSGPQGMPGYACDTVDGIDCTPQFGESQQSHELQIFGSATSGEYTVPSDTLTSVPGVTLALAPNRTYLYYFDGQFSSSSAGATIGLATLYSGSESRFTQALVSPRGEFLVKNETNNANGGEMLTTIPGAIPLLPFRIYGSITTTTAGALKLQARANAGTVNLELQGWALTT